MKWEYPHWIVIGISRCFPTMLNKFTAFTVALALLLIQGVTVYGAPVENGMWLSESSPPIENLADFTSRRLDCECVIPL
jgi:hypothetical protein